ncbi:MAG: PQQ-binding-like beta-propeller repeat protein, partial [Planctomycetota bacterium]
VDCMHGNPSSLPYSWKNPMQRFCYFTCCLLLLTVTNAVAAENWAHWRGPTGNGTSPSAKPPTEWSATKNVKWKVEIPGKGSGSPVIWGDKVFVVSAVSSQAGGRQIPVSYNPQQRGQRGRGRGGRGSSQPLQMLDFKIFCFDRATGDLQWEKTAVSAKPHEGTHSTNGFSSASPTTDGKHVYVHFGSRGLHCYDVNGNFKWKRDDFGQMRTRATFGEGSSPTLVGDLVIVPWDHEGQSAIYALNKLSGKTVWRTLRDEPTCWATPLVVDNGGKQQIVMNGQNYARAYDLATGEELWRCGGQTDRPVASAVTENGIVYVGSGYRGSFLGAFKLTGSGDIANSASVAWTTNDDCPDIASPLLSDGRLYYHKGKAGIITCLDAATGKPFYSATRIGELGDMVYASPIAAGGHVYLTGRNGTTVVIKDGRSFSKVSVNSVGEGVDATPAPVDNELFIRGEKHLFCIAE